MGILKATNPVGSPRTSRDFAIEPYGYSGSNPLSFIDPLGLAIARFTGCSSAQQQQIQTAAEAADAASDHPCFCGYPKDMFRRTIRDLHVKCVPWTVEPLTQEPACGSAAEVLLMRLIHKWAFYVALMIAGIATNSSGLAETENRLSVSIASTKTGFSMKEAVFVVLTIRNESNSTVAVYPSFSPELDSSFPDTVLLFEIVTSDGTVVQRSDDTRDILRRKQVSRSDFREISPSWFFGGPIYINRPPFAYNFLKPGIYRIRAQALFTARDWLRELGMKDPDRLEELPFAGDFLANGSTSSNELTIEILP
jgi:hypothetical protein